MFRFTLRVGLNEFLSLPFKAKVFVAADGVQLRSPRRRQQLPESLDLLLEQLSLCLLAFQMTIDVSSFSVQVGQFRAGPANFLVGDLLLGARGPDRVRQRGFLRLQRFVFATQRS